MLVEWLQWSFPGIEEKERILLLRSPGSRQPARILRLPASEAEETCRGTTPPHTPQIDWFILCLVDQTSVHSHRPSCCCPCCGSYRAHWLSYREVLAFCRLCRAQLCSCWSKRERQKQGQRLHCRGPTSPCVCLGCCHRIPWHLKCHKESTLLVVAVVSGSGRATLLLSHGQGWLMS